MHSDMYFRTNSMNHTVSTGKICNPSDKAPTANQTKAKNRFRLVSTAVRTRLAAMTAADKANMQKAAQAAQAGSVFGYAFRKWNSEYDADGVLIND